MAQFDYYLQPDGQGCLLDCQTDFMEHYDTRLVVPLLPSESGPVPVRQLNPVFEIAGERVVMATQYASTVPAADLRKARGSLMSKRYEILNAIDFLIS